MILAVLSDIHSNIRAFLAVINDLKQVKHDHIIILGDIFGYYPWDTEVLNEVINANAYIVRGNHDACVKDSDAHNWVHTLPTMIKLSYDRLTITACHGTPNNPIDGRYYPDDERQYDWLPVRHEVLLMGHTHYPLYRCIPGRGLILNPGSVGQPRDGCLDPSWCLLDTKTLNVSCRRSKYDISSTVAYLEEINWEKRSVAALQKDYKGTLR